METPETRPQALLISIGWFWLVNAGTILFLLLALLVTYPLYAETLAGWIAEPPLPGMGPLLWVADHLLALLLAHTALCLYALVPSVAIFRYRAWARRQLEFLSWASIGYTLGLVWVYFHFTFALLAFWFALQDLPSTDASTLSPTALYALVVAIGVGVGLMIGLPFVLVTHLLRRADLRTATR